MTKVQNTCGDLVLGWFTPQLIMKQGEAQGAKLSMRVSSLINVGSYRVILKMAVKIQCKGFLGEFR